MMFIDWAESVWHPGMLVFGFLVGAYLSGELGDLGFLDMLLAVGGLGWLLYKTDPLVHSWLLPHALALSFVLLVVMLVNLVRSRLDAQAVVAR